MADNWKEILKKVHSNEPGGPHASDWELMNAKIKAQPTLNKRSKRGAWFKVGLGLITFLLTGLAVLWLAPAKVYEAVIANEASSLQKEEKSSKISVSKPEKDTEKATGIGEAAGLKTDRSLLNKDQPQGTEDKTGPQQGSVISKTPINKEKPATIVSENEGNLSGKGKSEDTKTINQSVGTVSSTGQSSRLSGSANSGKQTETQDAEEKLTSGKSILFDRTPEKIISLKPLEVSNDWKKQEEYPLMATQEEQAPRIPASAEEDILRPGNGFQITGVNVSGKFLSGFKSDFYGYGGGLDIDIQRGNFLFNTGVHYYRLHRRNPANRISTRVNVDTTVATRQETRVDSLWIILAPHSGHYTYDTSQVTVRDTTYHNIIDTSVVMKNRETVLSYAELPVKAGYRFHFQRWAVDVYGGVIFNQLTQKITTPEETEINTRTGMDIVLQPGLRYYFRDSWSVFSRLGLRYGLLPSKGARYQKFYSDFQLGVSYHW